MKSFVKFLISKPWVPIAAVLIIIVGLALIFQSGDNPAPVKEPVVTNATGDTNTNNTEEPTTDLTPDGIDVNKADPDPHDYDPEVRAEAIERLEKQPALKYIPHQGRTIYADITNRLPDDRLVITVYHTGREKVARKEWKRFLKKYADTGSEYVVLFKQT